MIDARDTVERHQPREAMGSAISAISGPLKTDLESKEDMAE